jgi:hypothetical protein
MTLPQRLVDDPSGAPWLAERLRVAAAPSPMSSEARARIGAQLAARVSGRTGDGPRPSWMLAAGMAAALALGVGPQLASRNGVQGALASEPLRPEPRELAGAIDVPKARTETGRIEPTTSEPAAAEPRALPTREAPSTHRARRRMNGPARAAPSSSSATLPAIEAPPPWLREARAALATDPERTLQLIRANRDRGVAVSPELLDLAARAVETRHALRSASSDGSSPAP